MVSDINNIDSRQAGTTRRSENPTLDSAAGATSHDGGPDATKSDVVVDLSQASEVEAAARQLAAEPAVNETRVAQLRTQLLDGDYQLDAERIAQKLLASDTDFD